MSAPYLQGGKLNLNVLREALRRELLACIDKCVGAKAIIWDENLIGPIGLIAEYKLLEEHDVTRMYPLQEGSISAAATDSTIDNIIFIVQPRLKLMDTIADSIKKEDAGSRAGHRAHKEYHMIFVPRRSLLCERKLKELGVYGTFTNVDEYQLDIIPVDNDLLSMEMPNAYKELYLESDCTSLYHAAKALITLQALYGVIPNVYGKGACAKQVVEMMVGMSHEAGSAVAGGTAGGGGMPPTPPTLMIPPQVDQLVVIDRTVDPITPMLTQLTYEGLIDEFYTISYGSAKFPAQKFAAATDSSGSGSSQQSGGGGLTIATERKQVALNSGDEMYADIRDKNFNAVGAALSKKAKVLSAQYEEKKEARTVSQMKEFVYKLPHIQALKQSLSIHTNIAELIRDVVNTDSFLESLEVEQEFLQGVATDRVNDYIDTCIARQDSLIKVLRLICLQSVTNNGLKPKVLEYYKREIIQTYGFQHMLTLHHLSTAGYLTLPTQRTYTTLRKILRLTTEDVSEQAPTDISYVYSGYAPLSVRLVQGCSRPGWRAMREALDLLPGDTVEEQQYVPAALRAKKTSQSSMTSGGGQEESKVTLVFFIGGITFAEIAALRFLSAQEDAVTEYVIATTKIISGTTLIKSIMETLEPAVLF